jgi:hypothetical protein
VLLVSAAQFKRATQKASAKIGGDSDMAKSAAIAAWQTLVL